MLDIDQLEDNQVSGSHYLVEGDTQIALAGFEPSNPFLKLEKIELCFLHHEGILERRVSIDLYLVQRDLNRSIIKTTWVLDPNDHTTLEFTHHLDFEIKKIHDYYLHLNTPADKQFTGIISHRITY